MAEDDKKTVVKVKDRANSVLVASMAANIAGQLASTDIYRIGRNLDEDKLSVAAVSLARKILTEASKPEE